MPPLASRTRRFSNSSWSVCLALLVSACSFQQQPEAMVPGQAEAPETRPFPADTLYELLAAELAGHRGREDVALVNYLEQARKTRDPGIARQATLLARQMQIGPIASEAARLWASIEPDNPEPWYVAGQYQVAAKQYDDALQSSEKLLSLQAESLFVPLAMNARDADETTRSKLEQRYRALLTTHQREPDLWLGLAILLEQQSRYNDSLDAISKAQAIEGDYLPARLYEVDVLYKSGRPDKAIRKMSSIVADNADNDRLRLQYARLLSEQDLKKARDQFDILARTNSIEPELLLARALVNYRLDDRVQARDLFEQLLFLKKHSDTAHYYLGEMDLAEDKGSSAIEHFRRVANGPEYLPSVIRTFDLMIQQGQRLEGQKWLSEQRRQHPELEIRIYLIEADVLRNHDDLQRSLAALNEAVSRHPDASELYYARSLIHERIGDVAAVEKDLRVVLLARPDNAQALNALGYVLADKTTRYEEAYQLISRAQALSPEDPAIMDSMGWVLFRMGKKEEALIRLQQAYQRYPSDEVAAHLGEVLWTSGQRSEAEKVWRDALKTTPDSDFIRATRKRLGAP